MLAVLELVLHKVLHTAAHLVARIRITTLSARPSTLILRTMATASNYLEVTHEIKLDHDNVRELYERHVQLSPICGRTC